MPKILLALILSLSVGPALANGDPQVFAASTSGQLKIDGEGRVVALTLDRKSLGDDVMDAVEARVRSWRFEPVVEAGQPVQVDARLRLDMLALRERETEGLTLAIRHVQFFDAPSDASAATGTPARGQPRLQRPVYPMAAARAWIGGTVWLAVKVGDEGQVAEVATEAAELRTDRADGSAGHRGLALEFARAAERAARNWKLPGYAGQVVTVPVAFRVGTDRGERWIRVHDVPFDVPAWVVAERGAIVRLGENGEKDSARFQLLSAVN